MQKVDKHPTFAQKPIPSFQLLSKLSKFQGERKDIVTKNPQDILSSTRKSEFPQYGTMQSNGNSQANELLQQYQQRSDERKQVYFICFLSLCYF
jgi:hypothetical protein